MFSKYYTAKCKLSSGNTSLWSGSLVQNPKARRRIGQELSSVGTGERRQLLSRTERRESILVGAAQAFARSGFSGTSMEDIAEASGITKLIVYRHFESKEELYRGVLERVFERTAEVFLEGVESQGPAGIGVTTLLTVARENPDGFQLLWRHAAREIGFAEYARELRAHAVNAATTLLKDFVVDQDLLRWAAETVVSFLVEAILNWLEFGDAGRDDQFVEMSTLSLQAMVAAWSGRKVTG